MPRLPQAQNDQIGPLNSKNIKFNITLYLGINYK